MLNEKSFCDKNVTALARATYSEFDSSACEIKYEHEQLTGSLKYVAYSFNVCLNCNCFTHALPLAHSKSQSTSNSKVLVNSKLLIDTSGDNFAHLRLTSENYSQVFKICLYKTYVHVYESEIKPKLSASELRDFYQWCSATSATSKIGEREKLSHSLKCLKKLIDHLVCEFATTKFQTRIDTNENTSQESLESGYMDENSNGSAGSCERSLITNFQSAHRNWASVSSAKRTEEAADVFDTFEDAFNTDLSRSKYNADDEDFVEADAAPFDDMETAVHSNTNSHNNSFVSSSLSNKYSCSVPRSIPMMNRLKDLELDAAADLSCSFSLRQRDSAEFMSNKRGKNATASTATESITIGEANYEKAIAELASSIVQKDGTELFGDRPSRRIPINSISKSCCFDD